ncbi:pseudaminic acid synthase [Candidatus Kaiserbacteria bacterium GWA2_50_9]|uniref:Pseudaminic acid synthase n=1 Tax=Candidatus Kaiserbacteria bacterium GWA2_50_9 TaxID=1798474 RepID=A0A1F6BSE8_9BACT|nr:MAG: pseudaminic acid synthase [Candidatus Kaiserbacteria bacterium GWA2_50_9]
MNSHTIKVEEHTIGSGHPVFMIAEMSGNHNHDLKKAHAIIDAAADAGVDALKLQTYTADTITLNSDRPEFRLEWQGKSRTLYELYQEGTTPWEWHAELFAHARERGMVPFSSPFDRTAVDFLEKLDVELYKVASFEVVDIPLLEAIGKTRKPVIVSRGMSTFEELDLALKTLRENGTKDIVVLQCVSAYPAKPEDMNLTMIPYLAERFGVMAGLSDHTLTNDSAIAAVALGARVIEKHMTDARAEGGVDSEFSLEPAEFKALVTSVRVVEGALGKPGDTRGEREQKESRFRKSLFAAADIKRGEVFTEKNVRSVRPGAGLPPKYYHHVLGKRAMQDISFATPLAWTLIEGGKD